MKETKNTYTAAASCCKISALKTLKLFREIVENVSVEEVVPKAYSCN